MKVIIRKFVKWSYTIFAIAAISVAVVVQTGRSLSHLAADYPQELSDYLSEKLNARVFIGKVSAEWVGLKPMIDLHNLRITSQTDQPILALAHAQLKVDLLGTFLHFRLVWSSLQLKLTTMDFVQDGDGTWRISGVPKRDRTNEQAVQLDPLIDMALLSRRIELNQTQLNLHFFSGATANLTSPVLRLENTGDFHRLLLQVDVDKRPKSLTLIAEGKGDPRHKETFSSKAFVQLNQFPTNEPIATATAFLLRGVNAEVHSEGSLDASLWLTSRPQQDGFDLEGKLAVERLSLPLGSRKLGLDKFNTQLVGHWLYSGNWNLALQNLNAKVNEYQIDNMNLAASAAGINAPLVVKMQKVDLEKLHKSLDNAGVIGNGRLQKVLKDLSPQGELRNLQVAIPMENPAEWELQAKLAKVGVNAWQGVPALRNVDGYIQTSQKGGFVDIDSNDGFSMHYYPTYAAPMEYHQARGQVAWHLQPENNQIYVNSGALEFINGKEHAKGYLWLALPWRQNTGDIDLYLQIGAEHLGASLYTKYTPKVVPKSLSDWLAKSIGEKNTGTVNNVGFLYRGTLNGRNPMLRSHQLSLDIHNAHLKYHPEWPSLEAVNGRLLVSDNQVFAGIDQATLFDSMVNTTHVLVTPNPDGHGSILLVDGKVNGSTEDGLRVLRETMLRKNFGSSMDSWRTEGTMKTQVKIAMPLDTKGTGAHQQIDIDLSASRFDMTNLKLFMQQVSGKLSFNDTIGLTSPALEATLFDEPVVAQLTTQKIDARTQTRVEIQGSIENKTLARWSQRPETLFLQGKIPYTALVELNLKPSQTPATIASTETSSTTPYAQVTVGSPLTGVTINLPEPYGKSSESQRPLQFKMSLYEQRSLIDVTYDGKLQALFELDPHQNNSLANAAIALNEPAEFSNHRTFLVAGRLAAIDLEAWKKVYQSYLDHSFQLSLLNPKPIPDIYTDPHPEYVAGLPFRANITLGQYQVGPLSLNDLNVNAEKLENAWSIRFKNPLATGEISLPNDTEKPLDITLESLYLTSEALGITPTETLANANTNSEPIKKSGLSVDPRQLPIANLRVDSLFMDDVNYGNWSLHIQPNDKGVVFENIKGTVKGVSVEGGNETTGASLAWLVSDSGATTTFSGVLSATDIGNVLKQWQKPDSLESKTARFKIDISWAGDPQDFGLKNINGNMSIALENGRFKTSPGVGSDGFLRLMAILNFDSLARRLRLDFSDLYSSGLAYDTIKGKVNFAAGTMNFTEPLVVKTPSSRLQMAGKLDLEREKINSRLVATLPVVGNYTFFTALVTGLPAAAGIYLVSKLFKKQVDQATSISYSIRGDWGSPVMKFDRLFESEASLLDSVNNPKKDLEIDTSPAIKPSKKTQQSPPQGFWQPTPSNNREKTRILPLPPQDMPIQTACITLKCRPFRTACV